MTGTPTVPRLADVSVGTQLPSQTFQLTRADLVRYAGASGDFNPIHWSEDTALSVGLPGVIAHGMLTMATAGRVVTDWLGDPGAVLTYGVKFTRPVLVPAGEPAIVEVSASVRAVGDDGVAIIDIKAMYDGKTVLGKARARVQLSLQR